MQLPLFDTALLALSVYQAIMGSLHHVKGKST